MRSLSQREAAVLLSCYDDPEKFNRVVLGRTLWSKQREVCRAVASTPVTLVPAGKAVGKSFLLAGLVLWFLYTRKNSLVITTGPDHRQVVSVLWNEIRQALKPKYENGRKILPRINLPYDHISEGYSSPQRLTVSTENRWEALGFSATLEEGFSGQHRGDLLVVVDEASGIGNEIWSGIHGLNASRLVVSGNPLRYESHFRELNDIALKGSKRVVSVQISALDHPHAKLEVSPVGAICLGMLDQLREIHGEGSSFWRSNVLGMFPGAEATRFIPAAWIDACVNPDILRDERWLACPPGLPYLGVDIGGGVGGDRSVVTCRNRRQLLEVFSSREHGVLEDAKHRLEPIVIEMARRWNVQPDHVIYDGSGSGIGRSFGSYLSARGLSGALASFGSGSGGRYYKNRRTANAAAVQRRLDPRRKDFVPFYCGGIPAWEYLREELLELRSPTSSDEMNEEGTFKQELEGKKSLMSRLRRSPDFLDSFLMTFAFSD